jgi:hypothetical protein
MGFTLCSLCFASQPGYSPIIEGSGKFIRNNIQIPSIKKLQVSGIAHVYIKQSNYNELTIEAEDNILQSLRHSTQGDTLNIGLQNNSINPSKPITYILKIKNLSSIKASGNSKVICQDGLKLDFLSITMHDHSFANIWFNGDKINVLVSNTANLIVGGFAKRQEITINEFGMFDGKQLQGSKGTLDITYAGNGIINVHDELQINMPAKGNALYLGHPKINKNISRNANVTTIQDAST